MFGIVRPCRHRLPGPLFGEWMAHLCGLCLTLRDLHGQNARLVTNYDGLLVSVLTEAQNPLVTPHRTAGPCALRGLRGADVLDAAGSGAQLAAAVSMVLAAGKIRDHIVDRDGIFARRMVAAGAGAAAGRWQSAGERSGSAIGFDTNVLTSAIDRQAEIERATGLTLREVTEPTETAVGAAFAHTAVLAARPGNAKQLAVGRQFGRIAHLLDAVQDVAEDRLAGSYNPLLATATTPALAREQCDAAIGELRRSVAGLDMSSPALAESLLVTEVGVAVDEAFAEIERGEVALLGGWPVVPVGRGMSGIGLPCLPGSRRRRGRPRRPGRSPRRSGWSDCLCDCCCDGCGCDGCGEACGGCDCTC